VSTSIDQSFTKQFEREVHEEFQRRGSFLLQTVRRKRNVRGVSTTFQKIGAGVATTKARHGEITPMNQAHTAIECVLEDFYAGDWVDRLDETKTEHDERMAVARAGAFALGRKADEQLLAELIEALDGNDVPRDGQRFGVLSPRQWSQAMTITEFASADFVGDDLPFLKGAQPRTWMGVHWIVHREVPGAGGAQAIGFAFHRNAVGYASGQDIRSDITWHGDRAAHFVNSFMSGGACLIDGSGVVELRTDDTAAIPA